MRCPKCDYDIKKMTLQESIVFNERLVENYTRAVRWAMYKVKEEILKNSVITPFGLINIRADAFDELFRDITEIPPSKEFEDILKSIDDR